jgi:hypothetical protein
MNYISNPNFIYAHTSIATNDQLRSYVLRCIDRLEEYFQEKLNREFEVNVITKYDGTFLNHAFIWFKSVELANLLQNKTKDGQERFQEVPDMDHDTSEAEQNLQNFYGLATPIGARWEKLVEEEEYLISKTQKRNIKVPLPPVVDFGTIDPSDEQKMKNPDQKPIEVSFYHCRIPIKNGFSFHKLYANHCPKDVNERSIRKYFEKFVGEQKDMHSKKSYPIVTVDKRSGNCSIMVCFHPLSMDALFINLMSKKVVIDQNTYNFELYKERN